MAAQWRSLHEKRDQRPLVLASKADVEGKA